MRRLLSLVLLLVAGSALAAEGPLTDYIYRRNHGSTHAEISTSGLQALDAVTDIEDPPYFWARYDGREYVIRDAVTLRRISDLLDGSRDGRREVREIERDIRELERRLREVERNIRAAERERDRDRADAMRRLAESERKQIEDERPSLERKRELAEASAKQAKTRMKRELATIVGDAVRSGVAKQHHQ